VHGAPLQAATGQETLLVIPAGPSRGPPTHHRTVRCRVGPRLLGCLHGFLPALPGPDGV